MVLVDTNIVAYLLIRGDQTAQAQALFVQDSDWHSEHFILVEFTNVLATTVRAGTLSPEVAEDQLTAAQELLANGLHLVAHSAAFEAAVRHGVSGYDARFLALADHLGVRLVTEDSRLRRSAPGLTLSLAEALL